MCINLNIQINSGMPQCSHCIVYVVSINLFLLIVTWLIQYLREKFSFQHFISFISFHFSQTRSYQSENVLSCLCYNISSPSFRPPNTFKRELLIMCSYPNTAVHIRRNQPPAHSKYKIQEKWQLRNRQPKACNGFLLLSQTQTSCIALPPASHCYKVSHSRHCWAKLLNSFAFIDTKPPQGTMSFPNFIAFLHLGICVFAIWLHSAGPRNRCS